jgi:hypothetical protein
MRHGNAMKIATPSLCLLLAVAAASFAQEPPPTVARLKDVHGNVLVSRETGLASGDEALRLAQGTRVITTANADVVVAYDDGCEVRLKENQRLEVDTSKACVLRVAQASSILAEPAGMATAAGAGGAAVFLATLPALGGALTGLAILRSQSLSQSVSPS